MAARSDATGGGQKGAGTLRIVGVVVLALTAIGIGAVRMGFIHLPGSQPEDTVLAKPQDGTTTDPARTGDTSKSATSATRTPGGAPDLDAPALEPTPTTSVAATRRPGSRPVPNNISGSPMVSAVAPQGVVQPGRIDEHVTYQYNALNRRDPFQSLLTGEWTPQGGNNDLPPESGGMKIVGIVWGATDQFAMVEDVRGNSYVLRKGDKVQNGFVESLRRDAVVVSITADGQSQSVVIPFVRKGDSGAH